MIAFHKLYRIACTLLAICKLNCVTHITMKNLLAMTIAPPLIAFFMMMYWYQWGSSSLSPSEVEEYMAVLEAQTQTPGARHDLTALRNFLSEDDGKPIYTVNLYNFHDVASYPDGSAFGGTGAQAYERFSQIMVPLMLKRGSHPIYGSTWADRFNSKWDRIVIVRYRSRRDLVDLFATDDFADGSLHKWASLREHERMLVQALHLPDGKYIFTLIAILLGILINLVGRRMVRTRPT